MNQREVSLLIVEDEPLVRSLLLTILTEICRCQAAETAAAATALLDSQGFDIVLADIGLPGVSGLDLCRSIRARTPNTLVIMLSGKNDREAADDAKHAGAFDFLSKPFEISDVIAIVEKAIAHQASNSMFNSAS